MEPFPKMRGCEAKAPVVSDYLRALLAHLATQAARHRALLFAHSVSHLLWRLELGGRVG